MGKVGKVSSAEDGGEKSFPSIFLPNIPNSTFPKDLIYQNDYEFSENEVPPVKRLYGKFSQIGTFNKV